MTGPITTERHEDILVIISNNPPVNALGAAVRQGLDAGLKEGLADASIKAMVIRCDGRTFFAGADITEFGQAMQEPGLPTLIEIIEASDKPVVAAIHGTALGGRLRDRPWLPLPHRRTLGEDRYSRGEARSAPRRRRHTAHPAPCRRADRTGADRQGRPDQRQKST